LIAGREGAPDRALIAAALILALGILARVLSPPDFGSALIHGDVLRIIRDLRTVEHPGDIGGLYIRDRLWLHPLPYLEYPLEYPVLLGWFAWLLGFVPGLWGHFLGTTTILAACGLFIVWVVAQLAPAHRWYVALAPALACYVGLNWDLLGVAALAAALLAYAYSREGAGAALLAVAIWAKFFPIVFVPLLFAERVAQRRWRDALTLAGWLAALTALFNAPFAFQRGPEGWQVRPGWLYFFSFHEHRRVEPSLWTMLADWGGYPLSLAAVNRWSAVLLALGAAAISLLVFWRALGAPPPGARPLALLLPGGIALLGWWFFINKVFSPQYALWLIALLAIAAAPRALCIAWLACDLLYFIASFTVHLPVTALIFPPSLIIRQAGLLAIVVWAIWRIVTLGPDQTDDTACDPLPTGDAPASPVSRPVGA
jgi:hypothetical protein